MPEELFPVENPLALVDPRDLVFNAVVDTVTAIARALYPRWLGKAYTPEELPLEELVADLLAAAAGVPRRRYTSYCAPVRAPGFRELPIDAYEEVVLDPEDGRICYLDYRPEETAGGCSHWHEFLGCEDVPRWVVEALHHLGELIRALGLEKRVEKLIKRIG